jgi:toxin ParE1/3/4
MNYCISKKAITDLTEIWYYTANKWSNIQADKYYNELIESFETIANNFEIGKPADNIKIGFRKLKINSHFVYFNKNISGIAEIKRILHQKMDVERHF